MRSQWLRLLVFALAPMAWGSNAVHADLWPYTETVYTGPESSAFFEPTSYVVPSVYATAYYPEPYAWTPTAYYRTSYVPSTYSSYVPTTYSTYVPTTYYVRERVARRPLFSRRRDYVVPTTIYYPTSTVVPTTARYYAPTTLEYPVLSEVAYRGVSNPCGTCDGMVAMASAPSAPIERRVVREDTAPRDVPAKQTPVESGVDDRPSVSSKVPPAPDDEPPADLSPIGGMRQSGSQSADTATGATQKNSASPPTPPAATTDVSKPPDPGTLRNTAPSQTDPTKAGAASANPSGTSKNVQNPTTTETPKQGDFLDPPRPLAPVAPGDGLDDKGFLPPVDDKANPKNRESMKPVYPPVRTPSLTLLKGRIRSNTNSEPEGNVRVTVSSRTNAFEDRTAYSNEAGRFAMKVPDGDWTVKVTMPSGRVYPVYKITVTGGSIVDDQGQEIPGLMITR